MCCALIISLKLELAILLISNQPSFRKKHGRIQISHLILKSLDPLTSKVLYFGVQKGKTRLNLECGRALYEIKNHIPVFFDPKEDGRCIYYIGHWIPSPFVAAGHLASSISIRVSLQFSMFDDFLASDMSCSMWSAANERASVKEEDIFLVGRKNSLLLSDRYLGNHPYPTADCRTCKVHFGSQHHPNSNNRDSILGISPRDKHPEALNSASTVSSHQMTRAVKLEDNGHNVYDVTCNRRKRRHVSS